VRLLWHMDKVGKNARLSAKRLNLSQDYVVRVQTCRDSRYVPLLSPHAKHLCVANDGVTPVCI